MGYRRSLLSSFSLCLWLSCNALELNRHGFEGLLVAIHKNVPESELLLSNLQEFLARASRQLAELTSRTYFRQVTILVPETWRSRRGLIPIDVDLFEHADVRVVPQTLASSMSTLQPASCGKPGRYITVPDFVIMHKDSAPIYMSPEYQFLHEWAKFRYGVFDELGLPDSSRFPFAYTDGNTVYPVAQSKNVFGILARKDGTACAATPTGILHNDCRLYIDTRNTTMLETLMKMPYVAPRNPVAARYLPTKQNVLCNRKSTRELIFGHKDFSKKGSVPTQVPDTMFTMFRARSHYAKKVVLLIDTSESMARNNWVKLVHQGVARFIQGRLPPGFFFGMLSFSDEVTVAANITRITKDTRRTLRTLIPFVSTGTEANAFKAIIAAVQMLNRGGGTSNGGLLILITDSTLDMMQELEPAMQLLKNNGLIMNTVALGPHTYREIERLAVATGGRTFAINFPSAFASPELDSALLTATSTLTSAEEKEIVVTQDELFVNKEMTVEIFVEERLGIRGSVSVIGSSVKDLSVRLTNPRNLVYHETSGECTKDVVLTNWVHCSFNKMMPGKWLLHLIPSPGQSTTVTLLASSNALPSEEGQSPVTAEAYLSSAIVTFPEVLSVHVRVSKGQNAILGAIVKATVTRPKWTATTLVLKDDGVGADNTHGDGIYSAYFTQHVGSGRYGVIVKVRGGRGARILRPVKKDTSIGDIGKMPRNLTRSAKRTYKLRDLVIKPQRRHMWAPRILGDAGFFERVVDAGSFQLLGYDENAKIPPGPVNDLVLQDSRYKGSRWMVTLTWTAMGAHMDFGKATSLEVRSSLVASELEENFQEAFLISKPDIVTGTLTPQTPGFRQELVIVIPPRALGRTKATAVNLYFAMKTRNSAGQTSPVSNIARVSYGLYDLLKPRARHNSPLRRLRRNKLTRGQTPRRPSFQRMVTPKPKLKVDISKNGDMSASTYILITVVVACVILAILVLVFDKLPLYYRGKDGGQNIHRCAPDTCPRRINMEALFFTK